MYSASCHVFIFISVDKPNSSQVKESIGRRLATRVGTRI